jgi:hypothetical protein
MEPSDKVFDDHHTFYDSNKNLVPPLLSNQDLQFDDSAAHDSVHHYNNVPESRLHALTKLQSVFLAEGLLHPLSNNDPNELPHRFLGGTAKARATWFGALCLAGMGMFMEAYVIITTGQIKSLWHAQYPTCWTPSAPQHCPENIACCGLFPNTLANCSDIAASSNTNTCAANGTFNAKSLCKPGIPESSSYSEFAGIMVGMLLFGAIGDMMGRARAGVLTSVCMVVGLFIMTFVVVDDNNLLFLLFAIFFGLFGLGVGGEYPLTGSAAAEYQAESNEYALLDPERHKRLVLRDAARTARRGETISLIFAMQGVGAVVGSLFLLFLIYFAGQSRVNCSRPGANSYGNDVDALNSVWRGFYFIGLLFVVMLLAYRTLIAKEGANYAELEERKKRRLARLGRNVPGELAILTFYAPRLVGTGGIWLCYNFAFYGLVRNDASMACGCFIKVFIKVKVI